MPKIIECIESVITRGKGTEDSPARSVFQYYTLDGEFLAERDTAEQMAFDQLTGKYSIRSIFNKSEASSFA